MSRPLAAIVTLLALGAPARADWTPVQVGPYGPVIVQDWGLYRPGHGVPHILDGPVLFPEQRIIGLPGPLQRYFPRRAHADRQPSRPVGHVRPSEPFFRMWQSHPLPRDVTIEAPYGVPPLIVEPQLPPK